MSRGIQSGIFALFFVVGLGASAAPLTDPRCPEAMVLLAAQYQRASVRRSLEDPVQVWAIEHGEDSEAFYRFVATELEDRVLALFYIPAEDRTDALEAAALDFHLSPQSMQSILDYYAAIIFEEPRLSSSPESFWSRVEALNRALRLTEPEVNSAESRYLFYLAQLTRKSIPQLAEILKFSETRVRAELSHLKLSVLNEFERGGRLGQARTHFAAGQTVETIARDLGFGVEALRFILHYERELNRGSEWSAAEVRRLTQLQARGSTYAEIATELNRQSGLTPKDVLYRTEGAVAAKIDALNLSVRRIFVFPANVTLPIYGQVKRNGHLTPAAQQYVRNHYLDSLASVATALGVQPESLAKFIRRHDLVFRDLPTPPAVQGTTTAPPPPPASAATNTTVAPAAAAGPADRGPLRAIPVSDRKGQARELLEAQEKARAARPPADEKPLVLTRFSDVELLQDLSLAELSALIREAADLLGGVKALTTSSYIWKRKFTGPDSTETRGFASLFMNWAIKQWRSENPDKPALTSTQIYEPDLGGKRAADWLAQWKSTQGESEGLPEKTVVLKGWNKEDALSSLTADALSVLLRSAADEMGGVTNLGGGADTMARPVAAANATRTVQFRSLLKAWAIKQWHLENPTEPALTAAQIFSADKGGKVATEWLAQWKVSQGEKEVIPENTVVLGGLSKDTELASLDAEALSELIAEAAEGMGGAQNLSSAMIVLQRPLRAADSNRTFSFYTLLMAWAMKQWQLENATKTPLNSKQIFVLDHGGKSILDWLIQWKKSQGKQEELPDDTVVVSGLGKDAALSGLGAAALSELIREAAEEMGGVNQLTTGPDTMTRTLAGNDADRSIQFRALFKAWAVKQWAVENPTKTPLTTKDIFSTEKGGKTTVEWLVQWKEAQGAVAELPDNTILLKSLGKDTDIASLDAKTLSDLLREAAEQMGGIKAISTDAASMKRPLAAAGSKRSIVFGTLFTMWAVKQWQVENATMPALRGNTIFLAAHSGKRKAEWLAQWKVSQGVEPVLPDDTVVLKSLDKGTSLSALDVETLGKLLREATDGMGGFAEVTSGPKHLGRLLAAPGTKTGFTFLTLLKAWALKQWQADNPDKPALNSVQILSRAKGGKTTAEWLAQWKATQK